MTMLRESRKTVRHLRRQWFQLQKRCWQIQHNPARVSLPLFIVGCQRSGTNMLARSLDCAWETELYNENNPKAFCDYRLRDWDTIAALVAQSSARIVLFKPITDTYRTLLLLRHFPQARVLFALRHYDGVVHSMMQWFRDDPILRVQGWLENDFAEFADAPPSSHIKQRIAELFQPDLNAESCRALVWWLQNHFYFDLRLDAEPRVMLVQYEAEVNNPARAFHAICEFAGIVFTPELVAGIYAERPHMRPAIAEPVRAACDALWEQLQAKC